MADSKCWSVEVLTNFIELYRELPCLWKVKSKEYSDKDLKNEAYDELVEFCKPIFPSADRDFVYRKIQSLRGAFRKEFKKQLASQRSGKGARDIYTPNLWYYDLLLFTVNQESTRRPSSTALNKTTQKKKRDNIEMDNFMRTCASTNALQGPVQSKVGITEFEATGIKVAKQLERMEPRQAIYADSLITDVLKKGLLGNLRPETSLYDGPQYSYNSLATHSSSRFSSNRSSLDGDHQSSDVETYFTLFGKDSVDDVPPLPPPK